MSETTFSQRYNATTQTTTAGAFVFDVISAQHYPVSKMLWGAVGTATYVSAADPLPVTISGVATAALQTTANGILTTMDVDTGAIATSAASIDTKTPALGQALAAASVPVVLTAAQVSTLTPPAAITGFATETTLGTLSAKFASGTVIGDVNLGATDNAVLDAIAASVAGTLTVGSHAVTNAGTFAVQAAQSGTWNVTNISGTVSLPTGASTAAKQPALGTAGTASADVITVQGITSMTALKVDGSAVTQPVSGTFWQATQPVSAASLPLPTGAALESGGNLALLVTSITGNIQDWTEIIKDNSATAVTSLGLLDDSVVAVDAVGTSAKVLMQGAIRDDALSVLTPIEGDAVNLRTDANGALWVIPSGTTTIAGAVTNAGTFAVQVSSALPAGTNNIGDVDVLSMPSITGTVTANAGTNLNTSALALESGGNLAAIATSAALIDDAIYTDGGASGKFVGLAAFDANDTATMKRLLFDNANSGLQVTIVGALAAIDVNAVGPVAHDDALAGFRPVTISGYASATAPTDVTANGDAAYLWCLRNGSPVVNLAVGGTLVTGSAGLPVAQQGTWNVATVTTLTGGGIAHDSADSGNPVKVGARAAATLSDDTMVANADRTDAVADLDGALLVRPGVPLGDLISERVTDTSGTSTAFSNFAATASTRNYITAIVVYNSSATAGTIDFRDGTAGAVLYTVPIPATGGAVISNGGSPLFRTTANTALAYDVSGALTTVTISMTGFKSKV